MWDVYTVSVVAGDCVHLSVDNGTGAGDLLAFVTDAGGAVYGLQQDFTQLDDEMDCTTTPGSGDYGCPNASVTASADGDFLIAVAQWGWENCVTDQYTLNVAVNGVDSVLGAPTADDVSTETLLGE